MVTKGAIGPFGAALCLFAAACLAWLAGAAPAWANADFYAGGYNGIGPASGMAMILEQDQERVFGRLVDGQNNVFQVNGQVNGRTVQGSLYNERAQATFQLELRPSGVKFIFIPSSSDGRPNFSGQKQYTFARGRVAHPKLADYRVPPPKAGDVVDVILFLENYRGWSYADVATAYAGVPEADRSLFRLFDHLHADMMLRLCRAGADRKLIDEAAEGQPITCEALIDYADRAEAKGVMQDFYDVTEFQRGALYTTFACNRDIYPANRCLNIDKLASRAAMTWKNAKAIFIDLTEKETRLSEIVGIKDTPAKAGPVPRAPRDRPAEMAEAASARKLTEQRPISILPQEGGDAVTGLMAAAEVEADIGVELAGRSTAPDKPGSPDIPVSTPAPAQAPIEPVPVKALAARPRPRPQPTVQMAAANSPPEALVQPGDAATGPAEAQAPPMRRLAQLPRPRPDRSYAMIGLRPSLGVTNSIALAGRDRPRAKAAVPAPRQRPEQGAAGG